MKTDTLNMDPADWDNFQQWLRYHNDWTVTIDPWGLYGCVTLTAFLHGTQVYHDRGKRLGTRVRRFLWWATTFHDPQPLGPIPWSPNGQRFPLRRP